MVGGWRLLIASLAALAAAGVADDLCSVCACREPEDGGAPMRIRCSRAKGVPDMDRVVWPQNEERLPVEAEFDGLDITGLVRIPENDEVTSLSFIDNQIVIVDATAFAKLKKLRYLSLSYNNLNNINYRAFSGLTLQKLDLSNNKLSKLEMEELPNLKTLNLNGNKLQKVPYEALNNLTSLEYLYLSRNEILIFDFEDKAQRKFLSKLKVLELSYNKIGLIGTSTFREAEFVEEIYLSNNNIENIEEGIFDNCKLLKKIDLSYNAITFLNSVPKGIETINLKHNHLRDWPPFSENLKELDLSENEYIEMYNGDEFSFKSLERLNISGNKLRAFEIIAPFSELQVLDISNNYFDMIPKSLGESNFPALENLYLDSNPIKELFFEEPILLKMLSANNLKEITTIRKSALKIKSRNKEGTSSCINVYLSKCDRLNAIEDGAFSDIPLCYLDISYNNLTGLSEFSADWNLINQGINMQGNPWNCECNFQWVLDDLLNFFYTKHPMLLHELRCASPRFYRGLRFVHWYNHTNKAFCEKTRKSADYVLGTSTQENNGPFGQNDILVIVLFVAIIVGFIIAAALITYLVKGKYRHNQRVMEMMKRKRQTMQDAQNERKSNGQNIALTGV